MQYGDEFQAETLERAERADSLSLQGLKGTDSAPAASFAYEAVKRTVDIVVAIVVLTLLSPLLIAIAVLVRLDSHGAVFHRRRVLECQKMPKSTSLRTFDAFKFRTMIPNADYVLQNDPEMMREYRKDYKLRVDPRITRLGRMLRSSSLDELPQLVNVLRGQMTLVGPRMISPPELAMYGEEGAKLLSVKPGLTGLWQVSGRQTVGYTERVRLDISYIENRSLRLDLQILLRTFKAVLARRGAF